MKIEDLARRLRARVVSAVELAQESLRRIHAEQPHLNAFITITDELALTQARQADEDFAKGIDRGPLQGIPYALKDLFRTRGVRTTGGTKIYADHVPDYDCAVYEKLRAAGAVLMGKTGLHELAYGVTSNNPHYGAVRNPHDPSRIPGGSSGGSGAAVAAGMVSFAMGSDTGGSIRIPAAYCGCVGFKPTYGVVSRYGTMPLGGSLDHMGPMTQTARDSALVMRAIGGFDLRDGSSVVGALNWESGRDSLKGLRVGVPENFYGARVCPEVADAFSQALKRAEAAGAGLIPVRAPDPEAINVIGRIILMSEASALMERYEDRRADFGADVLALLDQGRLLAAADYINAQRLRTKMRGEWDAVWSQADVIFTPTAPILAPLIGQTEVEWQANNKETEGEDVRLATTRFVRAINVLGLPAVSIPLKKSGLPAGLQIIGRGFDDARVLAVAGLMEG